MTQSVSVLGTNEQSTTEVVIHRGGDEHIKIQVRDGKEVVVGFVEKTRVVREEWIREVVRVPADILRHLEAAEKKARWARKVHLIVPLATIFLGGLVGVFFFAAIVKIADLNNAFVSLAFYVLIWAILTYLVDSMCSQREDDAVYQRRKVYERFGLREAGLWNSPLAKYAQVLVFPEKT